MKKILRASAVALLVSAAVISTACYGDCTRIAEQSEYLQQTRPDGQYTDPQAWADWGERKSNLETEAAAAGCLP